jgi:hypothetical protein
MAEFDNFFGKSLAESIRKGFALAKLNLEINGETVLRCPAVAKWLRVPAFDVSSITNAHDANGERAFVAHPNQSDWIYHPDFSAAIAADVRGLNVIGRDIVTHRINSYLMFSAINADRWIPAVRTTRVAGKWSQSECLGFSPTLAFTYSAMRTKSRTTSTDPPSSFFCVHNRLFAG